MIALGSFVKCMLTMVVVLVKGIISLFCLLLCPAKDEQRVRTSASVEVDRNELREQILTALQDKALVVASVVESTQHVDDQPHPELDDADIADEWKTKANEIEQIRINQGLKSFAYQVLKWDQNGELAWEAVEKVEHRRRSKADEPKMEYVLPNTHRWCLKRSMSWVDDAAASDQQTHGFDQLIAVYRYDNQ